ncbi:AraC family transcriptional regulator [Wenyingzhuangia sp. 2_MG-2023]|uniref:AraC family transcriptional regulator n=1 Tax=Wenyingzhuangia sp. 2_MG-2023 TaxID=3062639 RepID=UPI0026E1693E|nr:AraC family transcriptional regulator [Wenyingzhuangia sp. 2_MG-2023]MDO6736324.1 AraC family transcriptional regulator [Wenyingzhuangia sp. 2_MG-2023]MDO6801371.1 AraC family transcriptional regulator [Wenyingzhuangia sp. 1_MG-2023]
MKLHLLDRGNLNNRSFTTKVNDYPYFLKIWHYHPELELVVILKNEGTCFVGDNIEKFESGDIVLLGKNLPHMWLNEDDFFKAGVNQSAIAIHFKEDYLGTTFFETPEMEHILALFKKARFGLKFLEVPKKTIKEIKSMLKLEGYEKTISFLNILNKLARSKQTKSLTNEGFINSFKTTQNQTQDKVLTYIFKNFNRVITLTEVAELAHMNPTAFSRYFKRTNRKTFSRYLAEVRIGYACKLLLENKHNISSICYKSGFNNISNFNRQFKLIMNCSPSTYSNKHTNNH